MKDIFKNLEKSLKELSVDTVYLFGSQVTGKTGPLSDYDVGVLFRENIKTAKYFDLKLKLLTLFRQFYGTNKIDLVILNNCPIILAMNVIKEGKIIHETDREYRVIFETHVMSKYFDRLYYEQRYSKELIKQLST